LATTLTVHEETSGGQPAGRFEVELLTDHFTARELIHSRVFQEVKDQNLRARQPVQEPTSTGPMIAENTGAGWRPSRGPQARTGKETGRLEWGKEFERALDAFLRRQILVLVDDRQIGDLDEEIVIDPQTVVTFVRLVPLVGG
jgi:hypothetical protein